MRATTQSRDEERQGAVAREDAKKKTKRKAHSNSNNDEDSVVLSSQSMRKVRDEIRF